jgi:hypothetical protein
MIGIKRNVSDGQVICPKAGRPVRWSNCRVCHDQIKVIWKGEKTEAPDHVVCSVKDKDDTDKANNLASQHQ